MASSLIASSQLKLSNVNELEPGEENSSFELISEELLLYIFSPFKPMYTASIALTCKRWYRLVGHERVQYAAENMVLLPNPQKDLKLRVQEAWQIGRRAPHIRILNVTACGLTLYCPKSLTPNGVYFVSDILPLKYYFMDWESQKTDEINPSEVASIQETETEILAHQKDGSITILDRATAKLTLPPFEDALPLCTAAPFMEGSHLFASYNNQTIVIWNLANGEKVFQTECSLMDPPIPSAIFDKNSRIRSSGEFLIMPNYSLKDLSSQTMSYSFWRFNLEKCVLDKLGEWDSQIKPEKPSDCFSTPRAAQGSQFAICCGTQLCCFDFVNNIETKTYLKNVEESVVRVFFAGSNTIIFQTKLHNQTLQITYNKIYEWNISSNQIKMIRILNFNSDAHIHVIGRQIIVVEQQRGHIFAIDRKSGQKLLDINRSFGKLEHMISRHGVLACKFRVHKQQMILIVDFTKEAPAVTEKI